MTIYTQLKQDEIREIALQYALDVLDFSPIEEGACNSNFLLDTQQGRFVLTVWEERTLDVVVNTARLLLWLEKNHFPTACLKASENGDLVIIYKNKPVMMKVYIPGEICNKPNVTVLDQIGMAIGHLHQISAPEYLPNMHYFEFPVFSSIIGSNVDPEYESWLNKRLSYLEKKLPKNLQRGLVHGDVFRDNVLIEENQFRAIIDFEEACYYYKIFDLGMAILGLCIDEGTVLFNRVQALVTGYQRVQKLKENEKESLQLFTEYAATITSNYRFWKYRIQAPTPKRANKHWEMVRLAEEIHAFPKMRFISEVFVNH